MSNYATLKSAIQSAVYTNGNGEITGAGLQAVLLQIANTVGDGYVFKGVATAGTSPGTPDANVFYVAPAGTYTNFGSSYTVPVGSIGVFMYDGSWSHAVVSIEWDFGFSDWQFVQKFINDGTSTIGTSPKLSPSTSYNTFKVYCPKGATCEMRQLYRSSSNAVYVYVVSLETGLITDRISKGGSAGYYDVSYTATDDCFVMASSYNGIGTVSVIPDVGIASIAEKHYGLVDKLDGYTVKKQVGITDTTQYFAGKAIITDNVAVGAFLNPIARMSDSASINQFVVKVWKKSAILIDSITFASRAYNVVITDSNFKITKLVTFTPNVAYTNLVINIDDDGYCIFSDYGSHVSSVLVCSTYEAEERVRWDLFVGSEYELQQDKFINNSYSNTLEAGEFIDESRFSNGVGYSVVKLPVFKGEKIGLLDWTVNSADYIWIYTDMFGKVLDTGNFVGISYGVATDITFVAQHTGYWYFSNKPSASSLICRYGNYKQMISGAEDNVRVNAYNIKPIRTLDEEFVASMKSGRAVKLGFLGDSTTDGLGTTGFDREVNGHEGSQWDNTYNGGGGTIGSTDYINAEAYPYKLEKLLQSETGNGSLRVYNMGWSGKTTEWAWDNRDDIFGGAYSDVECVGIAYGINDVSQLGNTYRNVVSGYLRYMEYLIKYIHSLGKAVFIVNPQSVEKGTWDTHIASNMETMLMLKKINGYLAEKYNLRLIDMTTFDVNTVMNSPYPAKDIMYDALHYKSLGHTFEAGYLFSQIIGRTATTSKQNVITYTQYNWIENTEATLFLTSTGGQIYKGFKAYYNSAAPSPSSDSVLMDVWLLNDSHASVTVTAFAQALDTQYCVVTDTLLNSTTVALAGIEQDVCTLGVGELVHMVVHSGTGKRDFCGFKIS